MARAKVIHSEDSCMIKLLGSTKTPEPGTVVIKFPGGHVEVTRTTDNKYWCHIEAEKNSMIERSRIDYSYKGYVELMDIPEIPMHDQVKKVAILIDKAGDKNE